MGNGTKKQIIETDKQGSKHEINRTGGSELIIL